MITILGPTASGKTSIAAALAGRIGGEIISADSRQVYRRMDIGTGKDLDDYDVGGKHIPYHLIDIAEPGYKYNLFEYQRDFHTAYDDITSRGRTPVLCGGTGLYIEAVLNGYALSPVPQNQELRDSLSAKSLDELTAMLKALKEQTGSNMHNRSDVDTVQRAIRAIEIETYNLQHPTPEREMPGISSLVIGVDVDRETRRRRISDRLEARLHEGMIDEVKGLLAEGVSAESLMYYGLEYKFVTESVTGKTTYNDMLSRLEIAIHQFAKRQMTWFRGMERRGIHINWIDASLPMDDKVELIMELNEKKQ
uniref:tRNA (adenosine(37)-N6)-dimethylallyltransferase MiaA n=1 Tax=Prevotella sp. TaxID=59823 RepID=UPI003FEE43D9